MPNRCRAGGLLFLTVALLRAVAASADPSALVEPSLDLAPAPPGQTADAPASAGGDAQGYDARLTAMLMNYCRESLTRIVNYNDRVVLDQEYHRLVNNIDVTRITDDEIARLIGQMLVDLNAFKLGEEQKAAIEAAYSRQIGSGVLAALRDNKGVGVKLGSMKEPVLLACQSIVLAASAVVNTSKAMAAYQKELAGKMLELRQEELTRLTELRRQFFESEYTLYRRHNLPDRLNLKEVQLEQYIKVLADDDPARRLARLERLRDDFEAFPPFWYQAGLAAQESGNVVRALQYYRRYEDIDARVFREDPDYVLLCMHRILLLDPDRDRDAIVRDLRAIEANTRYYYRWENMLFAALTYYMLGDLDNARRLIQVSIDEGYYVPLHEEIRVEMESLAASRKLADTRDTMLQRAERGDLADQAHVGRTSRLDALRALGRQLTDITVSVAPRSRSATNAKFAVPGYNVYLLGRGALKGDLYLDDCVVHLPIAWYETPRKDSGKGHKDDAEVSVSLRVNGVAFRAAKTAFDREKAQVHVLFPRVLDLDDIVKRGKTFRCEVRLQDPDNDIVLFYDARRVTDELRRMRPDLSPDEPYFELVAVESAGERYRLENGLIVPAL